MNYKPDKTGTPTSSQDFDGSAAAETENADAQAVEPETGETTGAVDPTVGESTETKEAQKHYEQLLRTTADFENFKKRAARERVDAVKYANESLLQKLIPILDNFDMALVAATQGATAQNVQALQTGVNMIHQQLRNAMIEAGLSEIDAAGQPFDPNLHEAVSQQESETVPEGHVLQQLRKGYKFRDRLMRPAAVVVAKKPAG